MKELPVVCFTPFRTLPGSGMLRDDFFVFSNNAANRSSFKSELLRGLFRSFLCHSSPLDLAPDCATNKLIYCSHRKEELPERTLKGRSVDCNNTKKRARKVLKSRQGGSRPRVGAYPIQRF